jgi:hypothetical protein
MKKLLLIVLIGFSLSAFAQDNKENKLKDSDVPAAVKAKFSALYPDVKAEKWEKEDGNYEVAFHQNKTEMSCLIDASGKLMETETEIHVADLPKAAADYIAKNKHGKSVSEASKIVDFQGIVTFEAEVDHIDLVFDKDGKFIKEAKD